MVDQKIVDYLRTEKANGYSPQQLSQVLIKQGYSKEEVEEAFNQLNKKEKNLPFSVSFTLLSGFSFISLLTTAIIVAIISFVFTSPNQILGYFLIAVAGAIIGFYIYHVGEILKSKETTKVLLGIFSPVLSLVLIVSIFTILKILATQLTALSAAGNTTSAWTDMASSFGISLDPIIAGILFYIFCNLFIIIDVIKKKNYSVLIWYLIAPVLFFLIWFTINLITGQLMRSNLF